MDRPAHDASERLVLDELFDLLPSVLLIVAVLPEPDGERAEWKTLAVKRLAPAYGPDEPESTLPTSSPGHASL